MKLLQKALVLFLAFCLVFALAACGAARKNDADYSTADTASEKPTSSKFEASLAYRTEGTATRDMIATADGFYGAGEPGDYPVDDYVIDDWDEAPIDEEKPVAEAGLITASAWNENENYAFWKDLFASGQSEEENGKFYDFYKNHNWGFDSTKRVVVTVKNGETPVRGAVVACTDEEGTLLFAAKTDACGVAYLFPKTAEGKILVNSGDFTAEASFDGEHREIALDLEGAEEQENLIQIMLVIDVTGSMGDELEYFQKELENVIDRVAKANDGAAIELALLFYRDEEDDEEFAYYDFVNVNNPEGLKLQQAYLAAQQASGGGDYPEAVDEALEMAMNQAWSDSASTRIIFHLLDAPPHTNSENPQKDFEGRFEKAVRKAADMGIRICPILCSGADLLTEYVMRQASIHTGGTSIFITDHSGIGGEHLDPDIPDMVVEKLNDLLVRLINGYHTGVFEEPVEWKPASQSQYQQ